MLAPVRVERAIVGLEVLRSYHAILAVFFFIWILNRKFVWWNRREHICRTKILPCTPKVSIWHTNIYSYWQVQFFRPCLNNLVNFQDPPFSTLYEAYSKSKGRLLVLILLNDYETITVFVLYVVTRCIVYGLTVISEG